MSQRLVTLFIVACLLSCLALSAPLLQKNVIYAINAGSQQDIKTSQGISFSRDKFFDTSDNSISVDYRGDPQIGAELIKYSNDDTIYKTERHAYNSFKYTLPVDKMKGQNYVIILKFCESYFRSKGKRMFNIKLGSKIVRKDMDIFEKAGGRLVAYDEYIEFKYVDGQVQIKGTPINDAIVDGKLVMTFEKTNFDNPIINGIVLYEGMIVDTDYYDLPKMKIEWENKMKQEEQKQKDQQRKRTVSKFNRKHKKVKIRNDHLDDMEEDIEII